MKKKMRGLTRDKYFLGRNQTKNTDKRAVHISPLTLGIYSFQSAQRTIEWVLGVVGYFILFLNEILMEKCAPPNGCFFCPFCDVYRYPCVQCRLEPVRSTQTLAANNSKNNNMIGSDKLDQCSFIHIAC